MLLLLITMFINIFSMNGQLVKVVRKDDVVGTQRMTIDINELSRGQYFLQLNTATTTKVAKFVVLN
ncbi:MAG: T9SS type A sorting domain-containing protein, partial [Flavobacteriales bacterium]|nr:T9SS type A sorting domain-containing protein [Flavobacteriales bacterium]